MHPQEAANANAYLRTKVLTASPEQLRLMLIEGAIKFARQGRDGLVAKDFEAVFNGFSKCRSILVELICTMRPEVDPDLCDRVSGLYTFMMKTLLEASHERDLAKADKVIELLEYDRQTWIMLMEKLAAAGTPAPAAAAAPAHAANPSVPAKPALSLQA